MDPNIQICLAMELKSKKAKFSGSYDCDTARARYEEPVAAFRPSSGTQGKVKSGNPPSVLFGEMSSLCCLTGFLIY